MNLFDIPLGPKIHNRNLDIATHIVDDEHVLVTGELKEQRLIPVYDEHTGEKIDPGIYHHMRIYMMIAVDTFKVARLDTQMVQVPFEICQKMERSLDTVQGLCIAPGFSSRVRRIAGGSKGCVHLTNLLLAMTPAVIQGYWADQTKAPPTEASRPIDMSQYLINSCWSWRQTGPLAKEYFAANPESGEK